MSKLHRSTVYINCSPPYFYWQTIAWKFSDHVRYFQSGNGPPWCIKGGRCPPRAGAPGPFLPRDGTFLPPSPSPVGFAPALPRLWRAQECRYSAAASSRQWEPRRGNSVGRRLPTMRLYELLSSSLSVFDIANCRTSLPLWCRFCSTLSIHHRIE